MVCSDLHQHTGTRVSGSPQLLTQSEQPATASRTHSCTAKGDAHTIKILPWPKLHKTHGKYSSTHPGPWWISSLQEKGLSPLSPEHSRGAPTHSCLCPSTRSDAATAALAQAAFSGSNFFTLGLDHIYTHLPNPLCPRTPGIARCPELSTLLSHRLRSLGRFFPREQKAAGTQRCGGESGPKEGAPSLPKIAHIQLQPPSSAPSQGPSRGRGAAAGTGHRRAATPGPRSSAPRPAPARPGSCPQLPWLLPPPSVAERRSSSRPSRARSWRARTRGDAPGLSSPAPRAPTPGCPERTGRPR